MPSNRVCTKSLNFGRHPRTPLTVGLPTARPMVKNPAAGELATKMQTLTARAKNMFAAQQRQKHYHDTKGSEAVYQVGAQLLLSTVGLRLKVLSTGTDKLLPKWVGPFACIERIGNLADKLELPETMRIHDVFHVSLLKPYYNDGRALPPPPLEVIDDEPEWEVERILAHRVIQHKKTSKVEYLIRFLGYGPEHDVWQDEVSNCLRIVKKYWDSKPVAERLSIAVSLDALKQERAVYHAVCACTKTLCK
ncbi:hypothetical protein ABBQ32_14151 [Trebouxia sp. C0010 RCD-2024]